VDVPAASSRTIVFDLEGAVDLSRGSYTFDWFSQALANPDRLDWSLHLEGAGHVAGVASTPAVTVDHRRGEARALWEHAPVAWYSMVALKHGT
jgi:hypothetical protein